MSPAASSALVRAQLRRELPTFAGVFAVILFALFF